MSNGKYALVTGASSGLGKAFALQCAKRNMNLVLLALPGSNTQSIADGLIAEYGIDVAVYEFDLTDHLQLNEQMHQILAKHDIHFLVNNAGTGGTALITETSAEYIDRIILLNVRSMALITRMVIPHLQRNKGYILNVASMAAFIPIAYKTVYPASKAFISSFSLGLRKELQEYGISVSVVYPGPIMTNSSVSRRIMGLGSKGQIGLLSTEAIAALAIKKTISNTPVIIPGFMNKLNHLLMQLLPHGLMLNIVSGTIRKEINFIPSV